MSQVALRLQSNKDKVVKRVVRFARVKGSSSPETAISPSHPRAPRSFVRRRQSVRPHLFIGCILPDKLNFILFRHYKEKGIKRWFRYSKGRWNFATFVPMRGNALSSTLKGSNFAVRNAIANKSPSILPADLKDTNVRGRRRRREGLKFRRTSSNDISTFSEIQEKCRWSCFVIDITIA